jgi:hypothetical protein
LGGLLEAGLKDQIVAVTFGTPGTLDYEIGRTVAHHVGVQHEPIDLTQIRLSQESLDRTAREVGHWMWLFDAFYNRLICRRFGKDATYWSGYLGGSLSGVHLYSESSDSWDVALDRFKEKNRFCTSVDLSPPGFDPRTVLPQAPLLEHHHLSYGEQLNCIIRQLVYTGPTVVPKHYHYRVPFGCPAWVRFILNVPHRYRQYQYLYKKVLRQAYPELFSLPTKNRLGLPLSAPSWQWHLRRALLFSRITARHLFPGGPWGILPVENYIDFDRALRSREDVRTLAYENIEALDQRGVVDWIDVQSLWDRHQRGRANHWNALTLLASLEVCLRTGIPPHPEGSRRL